MCLGIPSQIISINKKQARVKTLGKTRVINIELLPKIKKGDWILSEAGVAVKKITDKEASNFFNILKPKIKGGKRK